uniref:Uncharacterized protein n=1 Tax=Rhizophora mucronata TaxID=61149 RepID=A0A2P2P743_RHIMU
MSLPIGVLSKRLVNKVYYRAHSTMSGNFLCDCLSHLK